MTPRETFDEIIGQKSDEGYLDRYINKTRIYMARKHSSPKFKITKRTPSFTEKRLGVNEGIAYAVISEQGVKHGAMITYANNGCSFSERAIIAHELGHVALHYDLINVTPMEDKHEQEATIFAEQLLIHRSEHYKPLKCFLHLKKYYTVSIKRIRTTLTNIYKDYKISE
ncbi:MAG: ImmA/IrrE family metallo-endopeptidase [Oscillospiraceae bacterium]|nr:ImmA/IrrE family metallo-endopeptidase [Oscillospiraceae bacterium]